MSGPPSREESLLELPVRLKAKFSAGQAQVQQCVIGEKLSQQNSDVSVEWEDISGAAVSRCLRCLARLHRSRHDLGQQLCQRRC